MIYGYALYLWFRSAYSDNGYNVRYVNRDGRLNNYNAYNGYLGIRPALVEIKVRLSKLLWRLKTIPPPSKESISDPKWINTRLLMQTPYNDVGAIHSMTTLMEGIVYEQVHSFSNLLGGFQSSIHGKLENPAANKFEIYLLESILKLSDELEEKTYRPGRTTKFKVFYPKERDIESNTFRDKVVQHSLCDNVLYPIIQPHFIYDNYASQIGKGVRLGLDRLEKNLKHYFFSRKAYGEKQRADAGLPRINVEQGNYADGWVLKCDIKKFFANVRHSVLKEKVRKYIDDPDILWLTDMIIDSVPDPGIPIGFQTSQLFAALLLNDFDHMVMEQLGVKFYGRYVDDFYLISENKKFLQACLKAITQYLSVYGLELNGKTQIFPLKNGLDFLGFHTYLTTTGKVIRKIRKRSKCAMKRKLVKFRERYDAGQMKYDDIVCVYMSWRAHAHYGNAYYLISDMDALFVSIFHNSKKK